MVIDLKITDKNFNRLLEWIDYFIENISALDIESDEEILKAQLDLLDLKRSIARYIQDEKKRNSCLQDISWMMDAILDLQDELRIDEDLVKKGFEDVKTEKV